MLSKEMAVVHDVQGCVKTGVWLQREDFEQCVLAGNPSAVILIFLTVMKVKLF